MKIDHIGYAVKRIDRAVSSFEKLGFQFLEPINDEDRNVVIVFGVNDEYRIELVTPLDRTKKSPVDSYLSSIGPTPYHICYQTDDLETAIKELEIKGFKTVIEPQKAIAFDGKRVVFMVNIGIGLLEIVEK